MIRAILEGAGGRKFIFALISGAGLTGLLLADKLTGAEFSDVFSWLSVGYLGSAALQGSANAIRSGK